MSNDLHVPSTFTKVSVFLCCVLLMISIFIANKGVPEAQAQPSPGSASILEAENRQARALEDISMSIKEMNRKCKK